MIKEGLRPEHHSVLAEYGLADIDPDGLSLLRFRKNEYLLRQGYTSEYVLLLISGRMKVFITSPAGKTLLFCFYTGTGILGEAEFATGKSTASSSVQAITEVTCIGIPRKRYQRYLQENVAFMNAVSSALALKLFRCSVNSAATILHSLEPRLCAYIAMTHENGCFTEKLTEVSEVLGTSYRHLLRTLYGLCNEGVLEKAAKGYVIKSPAALKQKGGADSLE